MESFGTGLGNGAKIYFTIPILGGINVTQTMLSLLVVTVILCLASYFLGRKLTKRPGKMQVLTEKGVMMLHNLVCDTMGQHNAHWTPYIGTIFLSSLLGSLIGLTGFLRSTTADLSVPLTWGILTSLIIWYQSIKRNGFLGWLKGFTEPVVVMTPMNIISEIAQPVSMAFRHFGNVAGGGIITAILYQALALASTLLMRLISGTIVIPIIVLALGIVLIILSIKVPIPTAKPKALIKPNGMMKLVGIIFAVLGVFGILENLGLLTGVPILQFGIPAVLSLYFDLFSGFVQAFVFSLLSMVYIATACPPPAEAQTDNN